MIKHAAQLSVAGLVALGVGPTVILALIVVGATSLALTDHNSIRDVLGLYGVVIGYLFGAGVTQAKHDKAAG